MPDLRLLLLGVIAGILLLMLVAGAAYQVLRDSFRSVRSAQDREPDGERAGERPVRPAPLNRERSRQPRSRYTSARTRLRWHSPEIVAVLLLNLAAGLWLARLAG